MKRIYKNNEEAVSPVIATILMVAITVVLAAVLYVMVIGMGDTGSIATPLGLSKTDRDAVSVTIIVADAPNDAMIDGTQISLTHEGTPLGITGATLYAGNADIVALYNPAIAVPWSYQNGTSATTLDFTAGMTIRVVAASVSSGDVVTFSSTEDYFGTTTVTV